MLSPSAVSKRCSADSSNVSMCYLLLCVLIILLSYSSNVRALSKRLRVRACDLRSFELRAFRPMSCIRVLSIFHCCCKQVCLLLPISVVMYVQH